MASETTTANPELLQTQVAQLLVQPLEAASVVLASGVRIFDTAGPLRIPKLTAGASVGFVAEGGLSAATGAPAAAPNFGRGPAGYVFDAQGTQHVVYVGLDSHLDELWWG